MNKLIYKTWTFEDDQVKSGSCYMETSLPSSSLGINTLETVVKCADGAIADFAQNDPVTYFYKGAQRGIYYLQSVERIGPERYTLTAVSTLGLLSQKGHPGGIYTGQTVQEVVTDICGDIPVIIKSNLANIALYGWLPYVAPPKTSAKDNLSQVLFAIGAAVTNDLDGVLRIEPLWSGVSGVLDDDHVCQGGKVTTEPAVTAVSVTEHQYFRGGESKELFNGSTQAGDIITFGEPAYDLTADGFSILESGANYAKVSAGSGTLTGNTYIHNTRQVTVAVTPGPVENIKTPSGNPTLVSLVNAYAVAQRLAAYYKCRDTIKVSALIGGNRPGAVVSMYHPYDKKMVKACLAVTDAHMSAVIKADLEALVGFEPQDMVNIEYYDRRELISESGTFTIPDGVKTIRAVLIGGGSGGSGGGNGTSGTAGGSASISKSQNGTSTGTKGSAGDGGAKGVAGSGGKIAVLDLEVTPGSVMNFSIGQGGSGGSAGGNAGSSGGATTLTVDGDVHSSNDGSVSAGGYVDTTTGEAFAVPGQDGVAGAKGGSAGDVNNAGSAGASVGQNAGGAGNSSAAIIDSGSVKGSWVYDRHSISYGSYDSVYSTSSFTGYSGYTTDSNGRLKYSGSKKTVGVVSGSVVTGTIYTDLYTDPSMDSNGYLQDLIVEITIESGDTSSRCWRKKRNVWSSIYCKRSTARYTKAILPAGGGGAAKGVSGSSATSSCSGGNGASASAPSAPTTYGAGGNGGNGGGGGGAGGAGYAQIEGNDSSVGLSASQNGGSGGSGGSGSAGSKGANGCAILYFGEPHVLPHGAVMDKQGRFAIDRAGRLMVV